MNENKKLEKKQKKIEDEKIERRKKYGIQAALQNYRPFSHYNKRRNNNYDNNNKIKTRIKNSNRKGTMNKSNNKIIFENKGKIIYPNGNDFKNYINKKENSIIQN